jgi:hypothetical protein
MPDNAYKIPTDPTATSTVRFVQYNKYSTICTVQNVHLQKKDLTKKEKEININKNIVVNNPVNKQDEINENESININQDKREETINLLITEYRLKGMNKQLCLKVLGEVEVRETKENIYNFGGYFRRALETALHSSQTKQGLIDDPYEEYNKNIKDHPVLYNWLEERN